MRAFLALVLVHACRAEEQAWEPFLLNLYNQTDTSGNDLLSLSEWTTMVNRLGAEHIFTSQGSSTSAIFQEISQTQPDRGCLQSCEISQIQIVNWATSSTNTYATDFGNALVGIDVPDDLISSDAPAAIQSAAKKVSMNWTVSGDLMDYRKGDRDAIASRLATTLGVEVSAVVLLFSAGSVVVSVEIFAATDAEAGTIENGMTGITAASASTMMGCSSTCVTALTKPTAKAIGVEMPSYTLIGAGVGVLLVLLVFTCVLAVFTGKNYRKKTGQTYVGCCSTGCCSFNAMRAWSFGNVLAFIFLLVGTILLYLKSDDFVDAIRGIIQAIEDLNANGGAGADAISGIPMDVIDQAKRVLDYMALIILLPGILGAVLLLLAALLGWRRTDVQCPTKCCVFLSDIVILIAGILSIIFVAVAIVMNTSIAQDQLEQITGICNTNLPILTQLAVDAKNGLDVAKTIQGVDVQSLEDAEKTYTENIQTLDSFKLACDNLDNAFLAISGLFVPAFICVCAIILAFFTNQGLCCAGNCCKKPTSVVKVGVAA